MLDHHQVLMYFDGKENITLSELVRVYTPENWNQIMTQ